MAEPVTVFSYTEISLGADGMLGEDALGLLGPDSLGIEVTDTELAARCGLGNLDPQHGAEPVAGCAAIDLALLLTPLPPCGANLVTMRADADALGAMAVLSLRASSQIIDDGMGQRVREISRLDRFNQGDWKCWVKSHPPLPRPASVSDFSARGDAGAIMAAYARRGSMPLKERVIGMAHWLATGGYPEHARAIWRDLQENLCEAWNAGHIRVEPGPASWIALVHARRTGGLPLGYRYAPVVIAETENDGPRKITIAQFESGLFDREAILCRLNACEPGWGGQANVIGSPQGRGSVLELKEVAAIVMEERGQPPISSPRKDKS